MLYFDCAAGKSWRRYAIDKVWGDRAWFVAEQKFLEQTCLLPEAIVLVPDWFVTTAAIVAQLEPEFDCSGECG